MNEVCVVEYNNEIYCNMPDHSVLNSSFLSRYKGKYNIKLETQSCGYNI